MFLSDQNQTPINLTTSADRWRNVLVGILLVIALGIGANTFGRELFFDWAVGHIGSAVSLARDFKINFSPEISLPDKTAVAIPLPPRPAKTTTSTFDIDALTAEAIMVKDQTTGEILLAKNEYAPRPLASITKLLSALVILEAEPHWASTTVAIGAEAEDPYIFPGAEYRIRDLWLATLIGSSNRSVITLAATVAPSSIEFVARLNAKARELGMSNTTLVEPSGLDEKNISTAADIALLINEVMRHPEIREALTMSDFTLVPADTRFNKKFPPLKSQYMKSTDLLLLKRVPHSFVDLRGGKTGYIPEAGYNFTMQVADAAGHALNVVVLGTTSTDRRFTESRDAAAWVFKNYEWK